MTFLGLLSGFTRRTFLLRTDRPRGGVILDDRDDRPGVKFKDADLVGFPLRISIGEKSLAKGEVEIKLRNSAVIPVKIEEAVSRVLQMVSAQARPTYSLPQLARFWAMSLHGLRPAVPNARTRK